MALINQQGNYLRISRIKIITDIFDDSLNTINIDALIYPDTSSALYGCQAFQSPVPISLSVDIDSNSRITTDVNIQNPTVDDILFTNAYITLQYNGYDASTWSYC